MLTRRHVQGLVGTALLIASGAAWPDADKERENLAMIAEELTLLAERVARSQADADPHAAVRFRYDWLKRDLDLVRSGVDSHLRQPRQPRAVAPLRHAYTDQGATQ